MQNDAFAAREVRFPQGYGDTGGPEERLPWSFVEERLRAAPNYWITTITADGHPQARPIDGVWVEGALCFGGGPEARWVQNLHTNPAASVHLASTTEVVILEGAAEWIEDVGHPLAATSLAASKEKYPQYFAADATPSRPFWAFRPQVVYAWTLEGFPRGAARWSFPVP